MRIHPSGRYRLVLLAGALLVLGGCVTSKKYRLAKADTPPAVALDLGVPDGTRQLRLESVIVFKGPGSWKREARWDEYVIAVVNPGPEPLVIIAAGLEDLTGVMQAPGAEPWALERLSYTNWDRYGKTGLKLLAGAGAVAVYGGAVAATAMGSILAGAGTAGGAGAVLAVIPVVAVVDIAAVAVMNRNNRRKVEAEFARRRLELPCTVAPGETRQGSLFFPMVPSPRRLELRGEAGGEPVGFDLTLEALAALHLKPAKK